MMDANDITLFIPISTSLPVAPRVISGSDPKLTSDIGPLYAFDDALNQNHHIVSQSLA